MACDKEIDSRRFREAFYGAFDYVRQAQVAMKLGRGEQVSGYAPVGGGMHFRCFAETGERLSGVPLVIKIARPEFMGGMGATQAWVRTLKSIKGLRLVPPMEVLEQGGSEGPIAMVMPFGPETVEGSAPHWLPLRDSLDEFYAGLRTLGLHLDDVPQMRSWQGIPFIFDFSDLRPVAGRRW